MKNLLNAKWLLVINTLPVILLFLLFYSEYSIIKTLLEEYSITLWGYFGFTLFFLTIIHLTYTILCIVKKRDISIFYAIPALIIYTVFLFVYGKYSSDILPFNIPRWMISNDLTLYAGTFLMPTLAHALFVIVIKLTTKGKAHKAWVNFLISISIPLLSYLFSQVVMPLWRHSSFGYSEHVIIIAAIIGVVLFLFFLIRGIYILSIKKSAFWRKNQLLWKIPITIILPILGLAVNHGFLIDTFGNNRGIFGDFSNPWFYILAFFNGFLICLSNFKNKLLKLLLFIGRVIMFSFTFYFFLVFLPFLPLSIIAILAFGTGFLMLTPLVLFIIHLQELSNGYNSLKNYYKKNTLTAISIIGFLIIPIGISISFSIDKSVLNNTLNYVYSPDYSKAYDINKASLEKTLHSVKSNKDKNRDFIFGNQTPYISRFFKWFVLDNLTLSDTKINTIEKIFFNAESISLRSENFINSNVDISNISSSSTYNYEENTWTSWIDLEITNANKNNLFSEYATTINLPDGCWINDYYLYVGDRKEMGILAEKKSAMWVFSQIRNENRDPGLLHYLTGNNVSFRVFPFAKKEIRKTGIQFIHKDPIIIKIDNHKISLGEEKNIDYQHINHKNDNVIYVSSKEKEQLKKIKRTPYYHFIVDVSAEKDTLKNNYVNIVNKFISNNNLDTKHAKISFTNTYSKTVTLDDNWKSILDEQPFNGGFYLERAIKKTLFNVQSKPSNSHPIIIVLTKDINDAIITNNFADFKIAYPESNLFYHLNTLGELASHNLDGNPKQFITQNAKIDSNNTVLAWPNTGNPQAYLADNLSPSIVLKSLLFNLNEDQISKSNWNSGLLMQGKWISNSFYPEYAEQDWNTNVKMSFKSKIMTPLTSYIVVENEAQKAILKKKQEQVLAGKKSLDLNEDTQRMSEPGFIIICLFLIIYAIIKRKLIL